MRSALKLEPAAWLAAWIVAMATTAAAQVYQPVATGQTDAAAPPVFDRPFSAPFGNTMAPNSDPGSLDLVPAYPNTLGMGPDLQPSFSPTNPNDFSLRPDANVPDVRDPATRPSSPRDEPFPGFGDGARGGGPLRYSTIWFPAARVRGQNADWGMVGEDLSVTCPLWIDPPSAWLVTAGVRNRLIQTDALLPDSGQAYPSELWNVHAGLMYFRRMDSGWSVGGGVNLGSASDHPFASIHEMNVGMFSMLRVPSGERNAWIFSLMYAPTSELRFPIPGVAYSWNPSDEFHANLGLPLQIVYRPTPSWTLEASYMPIHTIHAKASYRMSEQFSLFAGYDWSSEAYSLRDRLEDKDRLFLYDQRVAAGLEGSLARFLSVDLSGGLAFDRYSFEGRQWDTAGTNRIDLGNGPFAALQVKLRR